MYVPAHFEEHDRTKLQQYIRDYGFGVLIVADENGIEANHVPFHFVGSDAASLGILQCHVARRNPVWKRLGQSGRVLAVFQGPNAYVSPSWYPTKAENGRVVPTWNYLAVHAEGYARVVEDPAWLHQHLRDLTDHHESGRTEPWAVDDAPPDFTERLVQAVVGIEIEVESLTGKLKASQNLPERNRSGVKAGLEAEEGAQSHTISQFIG